jgi:hypothetical protein
LQEFSRKVDTFYSSHCIPFSGRKGYTNLKMLKVCLSVCLESETTFSILRLFQILIELC